MDINEIRSSYGRCIIKPSFLDDFYDSLLKSSPLIKKKFETVDMKAQKDLLRHGLSYLIMYSNASESAVNKLNKLGKTHNRSNLDIQPWMYEKWMDALLKTIKKHDRNISNELISKWKDILTKGIDHMVSFRNKD